MKHKSFLKSVALVVTFFFFSTNIAFANNVSTSLLAAELRGELPPPEDPWKIIPVDEDSGIKFIPGECGNIYFPKDKREVDLLTAVVEYHPEYFEGSRFIHMQDVYPIGNYLPGWNGNEDLPDIDFIGKDLGLLAKYQKSESRWLFFSRDPKKGTVSSFDSNGDSTTVDPSVLTSWENETTRHVKKMIESNFSTLDQMLRFLGIEGSGVAVAQLHSQLARDAMNYKPPHPFWGKLATFGKWTGIALVVAAAIAVIAFIIADPAHKRESKDTKKLNNAVQRPNPQTAADSSTNAADSTSVK